MAAPYDLVVIGAGPAGEKAAAQAAYWGKRVAVIDRQAHPGGTMVGGAVSSKTMREAALYLTGFRQRDVYEVGLDLGPSVAVERLRLRTNDVVRLMTESAIANLARHGIDVIHGEATLGPNRTVVVDGAGEGAPRVIPAEVIIITTGSRPFRPPGIAFDDPCILDADAAALIDRPLRSLVVVGGGAVGCEFASIFTALGADVVLVDSGPRLLPFMDGEISDLLAATFRDMGMRVLQGAGRARVARTDAGLGVELGSGEVLRPETVIFAAGRAGNTDSLGLDMAGVAVDERGRIVVDDRFRTTAPGIYAAGDVIGPPALASVSMEQARVAACWAFDIPFKRTVDPLPPFGVYSIPEVAMVGLTEQQAEATGIDYAVGRAPLDQNTRATIPGSTEGMVKLVFGRDELDLLGVHIVGEAATELIHHGQAVIHFGGTIDYFIHSTFNVPTVSEAYKYAAYDGLSNVGR
ncbi:MAG: Si-specific NAD(P)(+) transhydrogenase [Actinomycetota bacterium]|nr:Si-specific NAD(P)(+) transhydrogenase [Actinomycetota bacterium]